MKRITTYIIIVVLLVAPLVYLWLARRTPATPPVGGTGATTQSSTAAVAPTWPFPTADTIVIGTAAGSVTVHNFYKDVVDTEEGMLILRSTDDYDIGYDRGISTFAISLKRAPIEQVRRQAEQAFIGVLNVSERDACKLAVSVTVPRSTAGVATEGTAGLSFCRATVQ